MSKGAAIPAVLAAQPVYHDYWKARGVDVAPFFLVLRGPRIPAPGAAGFPAGYEALKPYFDEMFLGRRDVEHVPGRRAVGGQFRGSPLSVGRITGP